MNENEMREAHTRAAIRVARRLGADTEQLHDVLIAVRAGWNRDVDGYSGEEIGEILRDTCDEAWQARREPYAPARSRMVCEMLGAMWPDVIADCAQEERELRKERERLPEVGVVRPTNYEKLARHFEERGDTDRAKLYWEAAAVMARLLPSPR